MIARIITSLFILVASSVQVHAEDMYRLPARTVYGLIPNVHYVEFDLEKTNIRHEDAQYLDKLFDITQEVVRGRHFMMTSYKVDGHQKHYKEKYTKTIEKAMTELSYLDAPSDALKEVEELISEAILEQYQFFTNLGKKYKSQTHVIHIDWSVEFRDHYVQSSHSKLIRAYNILNRTYFTENDQNKQAFYQHLCALDFI